MILRRRSPGGGLRLLRVCPGGRLLYSLFTLARSFCSALHSPTWCSALSRPRKQWGQLTVDWALPNSVPPQALFVSGVRPGFPSQRPQSMPVLKQATKRLLNVRKGTNKRPQK